MVFVGGGLRMKPAVAVIATSLLTFSAIPFHLLALAIESNASKHTIALIGANVVAMEREELLSNYTLVIAEGKIASLGPADAVVVPDGAVRIDARGKYVMPGLIDAFTHVDDESNLILFVANGVTTVRNTAGGYARHLALRDQVARGELLGPRIFTTGGDISSPPLNYDSMEPVTTSERAEQITEEVKRMGFDGVMVYSRISADAHRGAITASKRVGLPLTGHQSLNIPPAEVAQSGQRSVENLIGYVRLSTGELGLSSDKVAAMAASFRDHGIFVIPTLTVHRVRGRYRLASAEEERYINKCARLAPFSQNQRLGPQSSYTYGGAPQLVSMLHQQRVKIVAGTDAGYPGVLPGFSMHGPYGELQNLAEAGLSHYEALQAATALAAEFLGIADRVGTVSVGKVADLLLLDGNPLDDLSNAARIEGVFLQGRYIQKQELNQRLEAVATIYANGRDRFADLPLPPQSSEREFVARFELSSGGCVHGEERVLIYGPKSGKRRIVAQSSIDPSQSTKTTVVAEISKHFRVERVEVNRQGPEGTSRLSMIRQGETALISGRRPYYGDLSLREQIDQRTILAGPILSDEIVFDMAGTFFLASDRLAKLAAGQSLELKLKQLELDPDKHGRNATVGDMVWKVLRDDDDVRNPAGCRECKGFVISTTGRSGIGEQEFRLTLDASDHPLVIQFGQADDSFQLLRTGPPPT